MRSFTVHPIGIIHSDHHDPAHTPIQPVCAEGCPGRVEVFPEYAEGLADIEGFSHLHLIYWFHRLTHDWRRAAGEETAGEKTAGEGTGEEKAGESAAGDADAGGSIADDDPAGRPLKVTPFLDDRPHGVFAVRAPMRPNPIGLSVVRLVERRGAELLVDDVDILDGSPLLDIKPYVEGFDMRLGTRGGWTEKVERRTFIERGSRMPPAG